VEEQVKYMNEDNLTKKKCEFSMETYSQDGEDVVLASFFDDNHEYKGFYVDIGALHPLRFSNTQLFYKKGWRGLNIDATPGSMNEFKIHRPDDTNLEIGVSSSARELKFYSFKEPALNSFDQQLSEDRIKKGCELIDTQIIKSHLINEILEKYLPVGKEIDFINIDIEGFESEIIKGLDWVKYSPRFLLVESLNSKNADLMELCDDDVYRFLSNIGYVVVAKTFRTLIFKRDDLNLNSVGKKFLRAVAILANKYALKKSMKMGKCVDENGEMIPWYTYPAIEYIKQFDFSDKRVFEFGSGSSSFFWSRIAKEVVGVEDNKEWYDSIVERKRKNMRFVCREGEDYYKRILVEKDKFDVIIIDGKQRDKCCESALKKLKDGGMIILDNSERVLKYEEYSKAVSILKNANLIQVDFCGFGPINDYTWATSIFLTRDFNFKSKNGPFQPVNIIGQM